MAEFGKIVIEGGRRIKHETPHIMTFNNRSAWFDTERYIRTERKDLTIIDSFWGYALYSNSRDAIDGMEAFFPKPSNEKAG